MNDSWDQVADHWQDARPPVRPSDSDLAAYEKLAGRYLEGPALLLGSTPELRDLVAKRNPARGALTLVERSWPMYQKTSAMLTVADPNNEKLMLADWRTMELPRHAFSLILGDIIWQLMPLGDQEKLTSLLHEAAMPEARLIFRLRFRKYPYGDLEEIILHYRNAILYAMDLESLRLRLMTHLLDASADPTNAETDATRAQEALQSAAERSSEPTVRQFLEETARGFYIQDRVSQTRDEILTLLGHSFVMEEEITPADSGLTISLTAWRPR
jgi:hypothetical protein